MRQVTTPMRTLRLGTRRSELALAQAGQVAAGLAAEVELVPVLTAGDRSAAAITELGGTGVFVTALRSALLAGEVDLVVHSYKDLPTAPAHGLVIAAVPTREDPRDALVARDGRRLAELPVGARVGTGSPRRAAQLRACRPDLDVVAVRGNVDTRLAAVADGRLDAVVVARAGLVRLDRLDAVTEVLDPSVALPAPAQGALAVECRADDTSLRSLLAALDDPEARATVSAERALLAALAAGCTAPVAAYADVDATRGQHRLHGMVAAVDGSTVLRRSAIGPAGDESTAAALGRRLAAELIELGAADLLTTDSTGERM